VTAGNASGIVDGGAALLLASADGVKRHGLKPLAKLTHWAYVGVEPTLMGMGPVPATQKVLAKAGITLKAREGVRMTVHPAVPQSAR